jgi:hypothetical protein
MNQDISPKQPNQKDDRQKQVKKEWTSTGTSGEKSSPSYEAERKTNSKEPVKDKSASGVSPSGSNGIPKGQETTLNTSEVQEGEKPSKKSA